MNKIPVEIQDENARILVELINKYGNYVNCPQITYYVDGELLFKSSGKIRIKRNDLYPSVQIQSPDTGDYTDEFQENSCVYTDLGDLDVVKVEATYTPNAIGRQVKVKVKFVF